MRKILFVFLPVWLFAIAGGLFAGLEGSNNQSSVVQRDSEIKTLVEYKDTVRALNQLVSIGDYRGAYFLGVLYMRDFNLTDAQITRDIEKSKEYFNMALDGGLLDAVVYLSLLYSNTGEIDKAIFVLDKTLNKKKLKKDPAIYHSVATIFASFVLEYKYEDEFAIKKAIEYLLPITKQMRSHRGAFFLAFLYNLQNDKKKSDFMLYLACRGPNVPYEIKKACFDSDVIEIYETNETNKTNVGS